MSSSIAAPAAMAAHNVSAGVDNTNMVTLPPPSDPATTGPAVLPPPPPAAGGAPPPPPPPSAIGTLEAPVPEGPTFDPPTVPSGPDKPPRRRRRWWIPLAIIGFLLVSAVIGASVIEVPYYGVAPGDASPVSPRIQIDDAQTFSSEGEILFVTVTEPKLTALGALQGWLDPDVDVVPEKNVLGDQTPQENRQTNLRLMSYSKDFATYVALKRLGYDVKVSDGGVVIDSLCLAFNNDGSCAQQSAAAQVLKVRDVITNVDGRAVNLPSDIAVALTGRKAGDTVPVTVKRNGSAQPVTVQVTLSQASDGRPILGIIPNDSPPDTIKFQFPVTVNIDSGAVGGPSAGLAFTLALLDELTPGDLFGGHKVAATGTISPSGVVGAIGGLPQKTVAVEREGATLFLVPKSEEQEAIDKAKGSNLQVVGVDTLDDALAALKAIGGSGLPATSQATTG